PTRRSSDLVHFVRPPEQGPDLLPKIIEMGIGEIVPVQNAARLAAEEGGGFVGVFRLQHGYFFEELIQCFSTPSVHLVTVSSCAPRGLCSIFRGAEVEP